MNFEKAKEIMQDGIIVQINGWKYRQQLGHRMERLNGGWQPLVWPLTDKEISSDAWELGE